MASQKDKLYETIGKVLGIQYIYEEEPTLDSTENFYNDEAVAWDIAKLPDHIMFKLREAVEIADSDLMVGLLNTHNIVNQWFGQYLISKANNFDWDHLQQILGWCGSCDEQ